MIMDYEKKYKESMDKMSKFLAKHDGFTISKDGEMYKELSEIFPELKESEDERIRKWLVALIKSNEYGSISKVGEMPCPKLKVLSWLEKQGEQKPAEWSEEDKDFMYDTLGNLAELKDRYGEGYGNIGKCIDWLKSLRPLKRWKPSDEQMFDLKCVADSNTDVLLGKSLLSLYIDLKKLCE